MLSDQEVRRRILDLIGRWPGQAATAGTIGIYVFSGGSYAARRDRLLAEMVSTGEIEPCEIVGRNGNKTSGRLIALVMMPTHLATYRDELLATHEALSKAAASLAELLSTVEAG